MLVFNLRCNLNSVYDNLRSRSVLWTLAFLVAFVPSCSSPKGVTLLNKLISPPAASLVWSPNGNELAVTGSSANNQSAIYVLDVNSGEMRLLINQAYGNLSVQSWTPDGKNLAFFVNSSRDFREGVWLANINGTTSPKFLLDGLGAVWSSTGNVAVFRKNFATQEISLYLHDVKTNIETNIYTEVGIIVSRMTWSSDGTKLLFLVEKDRGKNGLYVFNSNTKEIIQVLPDADVRDPSWSPDGEMIAYAKRDSTKNFPSFSLHIIKTDGSCDIEAPGNEGFWSPMWSPDGGQVAFIGYGNGVYLLDVATVFGSDFVEKGPSCPK